jgi:hypothetical protein
VTQTSQLTSACCIIARINTPGVTATRITVMMAILACGLRIGGDPSTPPQLAIPEGDAFD